MSMNLQSSEQGGHPPPDRKSEESTSILRPANLRQGETTSVLRFARSRNFALSVKLVNESVIVVAWLRIFRRTIAA